MEALLNTPARASAFDAIMKRLTFGDGIERYGDLVRTRTERRVLAGLVANGQLLKTSYGCYALPEVPRAALIARQFNAKLTCLSAVEYAGLRTLNPVQAPHLALPRNRGLTPNSAKTKIVVHRESGQLIGARGGLESVRYTKDGVRNTSLIAPWPTVFARIALCQPLEDAIVAIDAGLADGVVRKEDIVGQLGRRHLKQVMRVLRLTSHLSQSVTESLVRVALTMAGLKVVPQVKIENVGYVDLLVEDRIAIELDGFAYHGDRRQFRTDRNRDRELQLMGYTVLRYAYEDVINTQDVVLREVRSILANSRHNI